MISTDLGVWVAAYFTITIISYAFGDNVFFKFAEKTFLASVIGNIVVMSIKSFIQVGWDKMIQGNLIYVFGTVMGLSLFARYHKKYHYISRYGIAIMVGLGLGLSMRTQPKAQILQQVIGAITPGDNLLLFAVSFMTTFTVLTHFIFTYRNVNKEPQSIIPKIGQYLMLVAFGAGFGNTVMTRMNLLIGRLLFLLRDWLGLMG